MTYSSTAILALLVHCIINNDAIRNRHYRNTTPAGRAYRLLMLSVAAFYISDAFWGILYDAHMMTAVFADTVLYFAAMAATLFLWTQSKNFVLISQTVITRDNPVVAWLWH